MAIIRTQRLTKRYGTRLAVSDLNLEVNAGEVYGFLGPNGAGKSTTIGMLLGLVPPTAGTIELLGLPLRDHPLGARRRLGVMGEHPYLYAEMRTVEYLEFFADVYRVTAPQPRIDELIERLGLSGHRRNRVGTLSRGLRQKLSLARALLHDPELLILDEPTAGLDPAGMCEVRTLIQTERVRGKTIVISSHILSEIERTADRVGIMNGGCLLAQGNLGQLRTLAGDSPTLEVEIAEPAQMVVPSLAALADVQEVRAEGRTLTLRFREGHDAEAERDRRISVSRTLSQARATVLGMQWHTMSLEEAFVTITEANVRTLAEELGSR